MIRYGLVLLLLVACSDPVAPEEDCPPPLQEWTCEHRGASGELKFRAEGCALPEEQVALLIVCMTRDVPS